MVDFYPEKLKYEWFCGCEDSVHDVMGQCDRCGRVTLEAVEKSLGLR